MKFKDETFPDVTFEEFCETNDLEVVVRERAGVFNNMRYYATCDNVDVKDSNEFLCGVMGNGSTKEDAVWRYAQALRGVKIVIYARESYRREAQCPNVWKE